MGQWSHPWNADCLSVVSVLALSQETRKLKRLARRFGLLDEGADSNTVELFEKLHEACHHHAEVAKALARDLDDRFRSTVIRVRSQDLQGIKALEMSWALPMLWAVLRDEREEVRAYGRHLVHALLWNALRRTREDKGKEHDLHRAIQTLEAQVARQRVELTQLREGLQRESVENEKLQKLPVIAKLRPESIRLHEPGEGRLAREVRKLRHDLEKERERVQELEAMLAGSTVLLPEEFASESALDVECESSRKCFFQKQGISPDEDCSGKEVDCCKACPLEGLRIAVVGGLSKMLPEYREVVRQLGAEFLFHDGEVRNGSYKLKSVVCGADIVVFITSVNSHGALSVVKTVCKKRGKKFIALRETGSESLARTLRRYAA